MAFSETVYGFLFYRRHSCGPPIVLQGFGHHLIQRIGCLGCVDLITLADQFLIYRANSVAEYIHLQFLGRGKALAVAVGFGDGQCRFIGILINKIAERIESRGLHCTAEDVQMRLPVRKQMKAEVPIVLAPLRCYVIIQNILEVRIHDFVFVLEITVEGGSADRCFGHDHVHGNFLEVMLGNQSVKGIQNGSHGSACYNDPSPEK